MNLGSDTRAKFGRINARRTVAGRDGLRGIEC